MLTTHVHQCSLILLTTNARRALAFTYNWPRLPLATLSISLDWLRLRAIFKYLTGSELTRVTMACTSADEVYYAHLRLLFMIHTTWILPLLGTVFNAMTILVMCKDFKNYLLHPMTAPPGTRVPFILVWLAIADILALYSKYFLDAAKYWFGFDLRNASELCCKVCNPLYFSIGDVAIWMVVFLTFERFCLLWLPIKGRRIFTLKSTLVTYTILITIVCIKNFIWIGAHELVSKSDTNNSSIEKVCKLSPNETFLTKIYRDGTKQRFEMIVMALIPVGSVFTFNSLIIFKWRLQVKIRRRLKGNSKVQDKIGEKEIKQIPIIVATSTVYLICIAPFFLYIACQKKISENKCDEALSHLIFTYLYEFMYLNHTTNFVFYIVSSRSYRNKLLLRMTQLKGRKQASINPLHSTGTL